MDIDPEFTFEIPDSDKDVENGSIKFDTFFDNSYTKIETDSSGTVEYYSGISDKDIGLSTTSPSHKLAIDGNFLDVSDEKNEEMKKLAEKHLQKVKKLKDHIIKYISENNLNCSERGQWKSDLEKIQDMEGFLDRSSSSEMLFSEPKILDADEMEELNDIYRRWS